MEDRYDFRQEDHVRDVERVMLYIADAQRKAESVAEALEKDGAEERFVTALRETAEALGAEHSRLLRRSHFYVTEEDWERTRRRKAEAAGEHETGESQQRMAVQPGRRMALSEEEVRANLTRFVADWGEL